MATWRKLITKEMDRHGDTWGSIVDLVIEGGSVECFDDKFDDGLGLEEGKPFTVWTTDRVYFPVWYDGSEWVWSASREPDGVAMTHVGLRWK